MSKQNTPIIQSNLRLVFSLAMLAIFLFGQSFFLLWHYGYFRSMGLISSYFNFEAELPVGFEHPTLIPKDKNNLFLFLDATHGNGMQVELKNNRVIFEQNCPFFFYLVAEETSSGSISTFEFGNQFELVKSSQKSDSATIFIFQHLTKALLITLLSCTFVFLTMKGYSGSWKTAYFSLLLSIFLFAGFYGVLFLNAFF